MSAPTSVELWFWLRGVLFGLVLAVGLRELGAWMRRRRP